MDCGSRTRCARNLRVKAVRASFEAPDNVRHQPLCSPHERRAAPRRAKAQAICGAVCKADPDIGIARRTTRRGSSRLRCCRRWKKWTSSKVREGPNCRLMQYGKTLFRSRRRRAAREVTEDRRTTAERDDENQTTAPEPWRPWSFLL